METVYTLNARDNCFWEVTKEHFLLNPAQVHGIISEAFTQLLSALKLKKIKYSDLKTAVVPDIHKNEVVLVFDTTKIQNRLYGYDIFEKIIPLFGKKSNHSVLIGDYIDKINNQNKLYSFLNNEVKFIKECTYQHSSQFFLVYLNNFSDKMITTLKEGLFSYDPFIGLGVLNYTSPLKTYISFCLCNGFIKNRNKIIMSHEDDMDNSHNQNTLGYPFEENGYKYFSLKDMLFISFLSYKIERKSLKQIIFFL